MIQFQKRSMRFLRSIRATLEYKMMYFRTIKLINNYNKNNKGKRMEFYWIS